MRIAVPVGAAAIVVAACAQPGLVGPAAAQYSNPAVNRAAPERPLGLPDLPGQPKAKPAAQPKPTVTAKPKPKVVARPKPRATVRPRQEAAPAASPPSQPAARLQRFPG
jgi:protein TonB